MIGKVIEAPPYTMKHLKLAQSFLIATQRNQHPQFSSLHLALKNAIHTHSPVQEDQISCSLKQTGAANKVKKLLHS